MKNGDLMIVIKGDAANDETWPPIEALFTRKKSARAPHEALRVDCQRQNPSSGQQPGGDFRQRHLSPPGSASGAGNDLNVMLFSDNVSSLDDELALKRLAHEKGLLMMGTAAPPLSTARGCASPTRCVAGRLASLAPPVPAARS